VTFFPPPTIAIVALAKSLVEIISNRPPSGLGSLPRTLSVFCPMSPRIV
jgi:hypothetical protein